MQAVIQLKGQATPSAVEAETEQELLWLTQLDAAQQFWHKLSRTELLQSAGLPHRLSRLLQQHYDYSREQADYQVCSFKLVLFPFNSDWLKYHTPGSTSAGLHLHQTSS